MSTLLFHGLSGHVHLGQEYAGFEQYPMEYLPSYDLKLQL